MVPGATLDSLEWALDLSKVGGGDVFSLTGMPRATHPRCSPCAMIILYKWPPSTRYGNGVPGQPPGPCRVGPWTGEYSLMYIYIYLYTCIYIYIYMSACAISKYICISLFIHTNICLSDIYIRWYVFTGSPELPCRLAGKLADCWLAG